MPSICIECIKHPSLKRLATKNGVDGEKCAVCHNQRKSVSAENNEFRQLFKALIRFRFHYHEWEYNRHFGGVELESLFYSSNPILNTIDSSDTPDIGDYYYSVLEAAFKPAYEEYDKGVTLFSGYIGGQQLPLLPSIQSQLHPSVDKVATRLRTENYFNLESEMHDLLQRYKGLITIEIPMTTGFFRARIGAKSRRKSGDWGTEHSYDPFIGTDITAPPPHLASPGRINRQGVSFFYAATTPETAVAEVRPHPGDVVSIGKFSTRRSLTVADFTETRIESFATSDQLLDEFLILHTINIYLNKVVPPSEQNHYSVTQLIADALRKLGYDGVSFLSTVGQGHNIVVFHPELMEEAPGEGQVFRVDALCYNFSNMRVAAEDDF
jgi:hypothetical protein